MSRKLILAAAFAALAAPAFAGSAVTVNLAGLDPSAAHKVIVQAAQAACRNALADETSTVQFYNRPLCIDATVAKAETKYAAMRGLASR